MRLLRSLLSLLLVFVLLSGLCLTSSYASSDSFTFNDKPPIILDKSDIQTFAVDDYYVAYYRNFYRNPSTNEYLSIIFDNRWYPDDFSTVAPPTSDMGGFRPRFQVYDGYNYSTFLDNLNVDEFTFMKNDSSMIIKKGMGFTFTPCFLGGQFYGYSGDATNRNSVIDVSQIEHVTLYLMKEDGSFIKIDSSDYNYELYYTSLTGAGFTNTSSLSSNYSCSIVMDSVPFNVYGINIEISFMPRKALDNAIPNNDLYTSWGNCNKVLRYGGYDYNSPWEFFLQDAEVGLLDSIKNGISNVFNAITELPSKIWDVMSDGLLSLFVPSEEDITEVKEDWDNLLSDRFGGLYQSIQLIDDYASTFVETDEKSSIEFPEFKIKLAGSDFVFGGNEVDVVPDGFEFLIDTIKLIISIIATCLFVNGLRNRFTREVIEGGSEG